VAPSEDTAYQHLLAVGRHFEQVLGERSSAAALMCIAQSKWWRVSSRAGRSTPEAALDTRMSSPPHSLRMVSKMRATSSGSATLPFDQQRAHAPVADLLRGLLGAAAVRR